ncbi:MAG: two-component regulator propeller domain-containing protein [bacterium]
MGWRGGDGGIWMLLSETIVNPLVPFGVIDTGKWNWFSPTLMRIRDGHEETIEWPRGFGSYFISAGVDSSGAAWLSAVGRGTVRCAVPTWRIPPGCPEIEQQVFTAFEDDRGRLWFTARDRLLCFDNEEWRTYKFPDDKTVAPFTLQETCPFPNGRVAVPVYEGSLLLLDPDSPDQNFESLSHPLGRKIVAIVPRRAGGFWVATTEDPPSRVYVEVFDGEHFKTILGETEGTQLAYPFHGFIETKDGALWCTWAGGVGRYKDGEFQKHAPGAEYLQGRFFSLAEVEDGVIWMGGRDKIVEFNGETWRTMRIGSGNVNRIFKRRDGSVWVASQEGVLRYIENSWVANTEEDGLPTAYSYAFYEDSQGRLWAGTRRGLALYHPEADPDPPETTISLEENLAETSPGGDVRIVYHGLDRWKYTEANRLMFSHRFDDRPWSAFTSDTIASATGLSPGPHRFEVKAIDRNWNIDPTPASFEFTVPLHWYRQPLFLVVLLLGSLTIIILLSLHVFHHYRLEALVSARTAQLRRAEQHLLEISEREQQRIGRELHDGVIQDLTAVAYEGELFLDEMSDRDGQEVKRVRNIITMADKITAQIRLLAKGLFPVVIGRVGLMSAFQEMAEGVVSRHSIPCKFECDQEITVRDKQAATNLYRIAQEAVRNAVKHAKAAQITIRLSKGGDRIQLIIEDNGIGIRDDGKTAQGMGLPIMRYRASVIGADFSIVNRPEGGTKVVCTLSDSKIK